MNGPPPLSGWVRPAGSMPPPPRTAPAPGPASVATGRPVGPPPPRPTFDRDAVRERLLHRALGAYAGLPPSYPNPGNRAGPTAVAAVTAMIDNGLLAEVEAIVVGAPAVDLREPPTDPFLATVDDENPSALFDPKPAKGATREPTPKRPAPDPLDEVGGDDANR